MPKITYRGRKILSENEIKEMLNMAKPHIAALVAFLYLYGTRITEALNIRKEDFIMEGNKLWVNVGVLKRRSDVIKYEHKIHAPLDHWATQFILSHLQKMDDKLWNINRYKAWRELKALNITAWLHLFRHTRLTKLAEEGATEAQLQAWAGWSDTRPAGKYIHSSRKLVENLVVR